MTDPFTTAGVLAVAAVYLSKTAYELSRRPKNGDSVAAKLNTQTELLKEIKNSQQDMRDGVIELVTIARQK